VNPPRVLVFDSRPEAQIGVRLAVASVRRHLSGAELWVSVPDPSPSLLGWLRDQPDSSCAGTWAAVSRDHPVYRELPLAVVDAAVRTARRRLSIGRFALADR
jgi:hypothetical protein